MQWSRGRCAKYVTLVLIKEIFTISKVLRLHIIVGSVNKNLVHPKICSCFKEIRCKLANMTSYECLMY